MIVRRLAGCVIAAAVVAAGCTGSSSAPAPVVGDKATGVPTKGGVSSPAPPAPPPR